MKIISKKYIVLIIIVITILVYHYSIKCKNDKIIKINNEKKQLIYYSLFLAKLKRLKAMLTSSSSGEIKKTSIPENMMDKKLITTYGKNLLDLDNTIKKIEEKINQIKK
jgi:hypothetical protein